MLTSGSLCLPDGRKAWEAMFDRGSNVVTQAREPGQRALDHVAQEDGELESPTIRVGQLDLQLIMYILMLCVRGSRSVTIASQWEGPRVA